MHAFARVGLGILVLLSAAVEASFGVGALSRALGFQFPYPAGWTGVAGYLLVASFVLTIVIRLGVWRLAGMRRGAVPLVLAFACALVTAAVLLVMRASTQAQMIGSQGNLVLGLNALSLLGALLFAVGLLLSRLVPRWIGWIGVAGVAVHAPTSLYSSRATNQLLVFAYSANDWLRGALPVIELVFLVALGVSLILGLSAESPTSNKRFERTA